MRKKAHEATVAISAARTSRSSHERKLRCACLRVDPIAIEVGVGLAYLAAGGAELAAPAEDLRHSPPLCDNHGICVSAGRVTDNVGLRGREYTMLIKGGEAGRYELTNGCELAVPTAKAQPMEGQADTGAGLRTERVMDSAGQYRTGPQVGIHRCRCDQCARYTPDGDCVSGMPMRSSRARMPKHSVIVLHRKVRRLSKI